MKKIAFLLSVALLTITLSASAQINNDVEDHQQYPVVTKGFYSIDNNAKKLMPVTRLAVMDAGFPQVNKGHYALEQNRKQLKKQKSILNTGNSATPVVTKGYYSIGTNAEKLQNK